MSGHVIVCLSSCLCLCRKATGSLKIVHEVYAKNSGLADKLREDLSVAMAHNEQLAQCVGESMLLLFCGGGGGRVRGHGGPAPPN
jgi:hypothetical protein